MFTLLIVLACIIAHTVAASATSYLLGKLDLDSDSLMASAEVPLCMLMWPIVLIGIVIMLGGRRGRGRVAEWRDEALASRRTVTELRAQIYELGIRPPAQGVHR